jgi:hypothetical protein
VGYPTKISASGGKVMFDDDQETPNAQVVDYEFEVAATTSPTSSIDAERVVLRLRGGDTPNKLVVRRGLKRAAGDPEVNEANLALLLR